MSDTLFVVSAALPNGLESVPGPRKDYLMLARELNATVLDRSAVEKSALARLFARIVGKSAAQAWLAFRRRNDFQVFLTDGEHVGIPLALLLKLARSPRAHVTIAHRLTSAKKRPFFRWLKVHRHITRIAVHSRLQHELAVSELGIPADQLALVPYQVDTDYWQPQSVPEERLICSAGLEFRDYPTLFRAVEGLDVRVVVGASSHWSRRRNTAATVERPANIEVGSFDYPALRNLYARSSVVVVPLEDIDFQAGVTTILEAMAMGKPVIVTHSQGQTDVVEDRRNITRGAPPRRRPVSLLRTVADLTGVSLEPNGLYVIPGDPAALRRAIVYLLDHPEERARLGAAGRQAVERLMTVEQFAERMRTVVEGARAASTEPASKRHSDVEPVSTQPSQS